MLRLAPEHYRPGADYGGGYGDEVAQATRRRLATRIARAHGLQVSEGWPMPLLGVDCFVMTAAPGRSAETLSAELARDPGVSWSEPLHIYHARSTPARGDPLYPAQPAARAWHLADLHRAASGRGVSVAIIDSAIERAHPDLAGQLSARENFVTGPDVAAEDHGTEIAGVIAAIPDNGLGIAGIAPGARLLGLRACWQVAASTLCDSLSLAKALHFAILRGTPIINMSLSGPRDRLLAQLIAIGRARGATIVAAFDRAEADGGFPASEPGVLAVADAPLARPRETVYVAPGRDVPTTQAGGRWGLVNGSSFAAAHISGLMALVRERRGTPVLVTAAGWVDACATLDRASGVGQRACGAAPPGLAHRR